MSINIIIDRAHHPVGWALFLDELGDAYDHLGDLLKRTAEDSGYSEEALRVDLGHVYAHLNRAWFRRNVIDDFPDSEWGAATRFPDDLEPVG